MKKKVIYNVFKDNTELLPSHSSRRKELDLQVKKLTEQYNARNATKEK